MKKLIALLLSVIMLLGLVACGGDGNKETAGNSGSDAPIIKERILEVGYGKAKINPTEPVEMNGGWYTGTLGDIFAITVAFRDEDKNLHIHVVTDLSWGGMSDNGPKGSLGVCDMVRVAAEEQLGISPEYITVGGTHNHSQVAYGSKDPANERWRQNILIPQIMASIQQAINDLSPAEMYIARTETENLTFVRRYFLTDGSLYEGYTGNRDGEIVRHETEADEEIQLVKFVREGKKDVLMINWQSHATRATSTGTDVHADYVGPLRERVEEELDVQCVYYQGACGNTVPSSRIPGEHAVKETGWLGAQKTGWAIAAYVLDAFESELFEKVTTGLLQVKRITVNGDVYKFDPSMIDNAKKVQEYHKTASNNYDTARFAKQFGIETIYHANAIIANSKLPDKKTYELNIISIGDVAFTTLPMEFFDTTGMQIKSGSPYEMTIMLGYSCSKGNYVPDLDAYARGGYESYKTYFVPGTAEIAVGHYLNTLNELYQIRFVE